ALEIHLSLLPVDGSLLILLGDISLPSNKLKSSFLEPLLSSFNLTFTSLLRCTKLDILDLIFSRPTRMRWISKYRYFFSSLLPAINLLCPLFFKPP
ncbi:hypothetical protein NFI96_031478, partial [Prochilodus magdalenae]